MLYTEACRAVGNNEHMPLMNQIREGICLPKNYIYIIFYTGYLLSIVREEREKKRERERYKYRHSVTRRDKKSGT